VPALNDDLWAFENIGGDIFILCLQFVVWTVILIIIEANLCACCRKIKIPEKMKLKKKID